METSSKKILAVCSGISMILLSASAFFLSVKSSFAGNENSSFVKSSVFQTTGSTGKFMMNYQVFKYQDGGEGYNVLVWDTQTGKAKIYYYDTTEKKMKVWEAGAIPSNPL